MKFKFKIQGYQTDAVENTTHIFVGQPNRDPSKYRRDLGKGGAGVIRFDGDDDCCTQLFNEMSTDNVKYHKVTNYQDLIDAMTSIKQ